jgi:hypothetical protein
LVVASYLWGTDPYTIEDVRLLARMVDRHLTVPHEFVCITDNVEQFTDSDIRPVPIDRSLFLGKGNMQQLMPFAPYARELIGERVLTMDLDCAVVGNMNALVERDEDLVLWRNPARRPWGLPTGKGRLRPLFNASMMLVSTKPDWHIWRWFTPEAAKGDNSQEWISSWAGPLCAYWDDADGVYRLEREDTPGSGLRPHEPLPENARVVFCVGSQHKPHLPEIQAAYPFLAEHRA